MGLRRGINPVEERWKQEDVALPLLPAPRKVDQTWLSFTIVTQRGGRSPGSLGFSAAAPPAPPSPSGSGRGGHRLGRVLFPLLPSGTESTLEPPLSCKALAVSSSPAALTDVKSQRRSRGREVLRTSEVAKRHRLSTRTVLSIYPLLQAQWSATPHTGCLDGHH